MEPDLPSTAHMKFVDNRCACCPYGYHIDIDFLRYLESLQGRGSDLDLRQIQDSRLRKSMEMFLRQQQQQQQVSGGMRRTVDDVDGYGTGSLYKQSAGGYVQSVVERGDEMLDTRPLYRSEAAVSVPRDYDSQSSSVSVHSGPTSPAPYLQTAVDVLPVTGAVRRGGGGGAGGAWTQNGVSEMSMTQTQQQMMAQSQSHTTSQAVVTSGGLTDEVETFLVDGVVNPGHPGIPADMTLISSATLQTIREQMAASVQRMKQLEDENLALRQLEVSQHMTSPLQFCC